MHKHRVAQPHRQTAAAVRTISAAFSDPSTTLQPLQPASEVFTSSIVPRGTVVAVIAQLLTRMTAQSAMRTATLEPRMLRSRSSLFSEERNRKAGPPAGPRTSTCGGTVNSATPPPLPRS